MNINYGIPFGESTEYNKPSEPKSFRFIETEKGFYIQRYLATFTQKCKRNWLGIKKYYTVDTYRWITFKDNQAKTLDIGIKPPKYYESLEAAKEYAALVKHNEDTYPIYHY